MASISWGMAKWRYLISQNQSRLSSIRSHGSVSIDESLKGIFTHDDAEHDGIEMYCGRSQFRLSIAEHFERMVSILIFTAHEQAPSIRLCYRRQVMKVSI